MDFKNFENDNKVNITIAKNFNKNPEAKENKEIKKPFEGSVNVENIESTTNVTPLNPDSKEISAKENKNKENLNANKNPKTETSPIDNEIKIENNNKKKFTDVDLKIIDEVKTINKIDLKLYNRLVQNI